jgi:hypothetical protein
MILGIKTPPGMVLVPMVYTVFIAVSSGCEDFANQTNMVAIIAVSPGSASLLRSLTKTAQDGTEFLVYVLGEISTNTPFQIELPGKSQGMAGTVATPPAIT